MNQKLIDQLLHKAGARFGAEGTDYSDFTSSKFAELIVRECLDIAKNWEDQLENTNLVKESNAVGIVGYRIARNFGVKE
jgi:hypothetical protein